MDRQLILWLRVRRALQALLGVGVLLAVWFVSVRSGDDAEPVLPNTSAQFSLDLEVIESVDHGLVYVVEQRARPAYRIFEFDPSTGADRTVFTVPDDAIIFGMALSGDAQTLAVAYSPDFQVQGSGLWLLDLESDDFTEIVPAVADVYLTEPEWDADDTVVYATHVDRTGEDEDLAIVAITLDDANVTTNATVTTVVEDGITPAVNGTDLYYLEVDEENARRAIGLVASDGATRSIAVGNGDLDLDHLVTPTSGETLWVAVLDATEKSTVTVGSEAGAHGNHAVPSRWWDTSLASPRLEPTAIEPIIVYDADISPDGNLVLATLTGLSLTQDGERVDVIASRAIRFVAA